MTADDALKPGLGAVSPSVGLDGCLYDHFPPWSIGCLAFLTRNDLGIFDTIQ